MLPILPALLLLFLQGPANIERLAHEGRLPAALEAVQRIEGHSDASLAALLAASSTTELSSALLALFRLSETTPQAAREPIEDRLEYPDIPARKPFWGFASCQRSRDGPLRIV